MNTEDKAASLMQHIEPARYTKVQDEPASAFTKGAFVPEEHAAWHYLLQARKAFKHENRNLVLEGSENNLVNYKQVFLTTAVKYGVTPEQMVRAMPIALFTARALGLDELIALQTDVIYPYRKEGGVCEKPISSGSVIVQR